MIQIPDHIIDNSLNITDIFLKNPKCYINTKKNNSMNKKLVSLLKRLLIFKEITYIILNRHHHQKILKLFDKYYDVNRINTLDLKIGDIYYQLLCVSTDNPKDLIRLNSIQLNHILAIFNLSLNTLSLFIKKRLIIVYEYHLNDINLMISLYYKNEPLSRYVLNLNLKLNIFNGVLGLQWFYLKIRYGNIEVKWINEDYLKTDPGYDILYGNIKVNVKTINNIDNKVCIHYSYDLCDVYILILINTILLFKKYLALFLGYTFKKDIINGGRSYIYLNSTDFKKEMI